MKKFLIIGILILVGLLVAQGLHRIYKPTKIYGWLKVRGDVSPIYDQRYTLGDSSHWWDSVYVATGRFLNLQVDGNDSLAALIFIRTDSLKSDSINRQLEWTGPGGYKADKFTTGAQGIISFPYVDLDIDDTEEYELTAADGKAGWGMASMEDEWTFFRFTAAGVVTLVNETANVSTTDDQDTDFNIYDSGTTITFENQLGDDKELNINVWYVD